MSYVSNKLEGRSVSEVLNDPDIKKMAGLLAQDNVTLDGFGLEQETRDELALYTDGELRNRAIQAFVELALRNGTPASIEAQRAAQAGSLKALENLTEIHNTLTQEDALVA